jgi:hypothetical protein
VLTAYVRFGSLADIGGCQSDVRFTPESGHWLKIECPLSANSGHLTVHSITSLALRGDGMMSTLGLTF